MKVCPKCGWDRFSANQICRCDIIVNSENEFIRNNTEDNSVFISSTEAPYGPYICEGCGAEYDDLEDELVERNELIGRRVYVYQKKMIREGNIISFNNLDMPCVEFDDGEIMILDPIVNKYEILEPEEDDEEEEEEIIPRILLKDISRKQYDELADYMYKHDIEFDEL